MSRRPRILITNDDGISAPGIQSLWEALVDRADVTVVAPAFEQSGVGLAITVATPIRVSRVPLYGTTPCWRVFGSPADCVKMALSSILEDWPDLVVSGINSDCNHGRNVLYSGTVGATIEAVMRGVPAIAFSCHGKTHSPCYTITEPYIPLIVDYVLENPLPPDTLLNVNFPELPLCDIKGIKLTRQGKRFWTEDLVQREHPVSGSPYYWMGRKLTDHDEHEDSDVQWLEQGFITAVPIDVGDLTHHEELEKRKADFESRFLSLVTL